MEISSICEFNQFSPVDYMNYIALILKVLLLSKRSTKALIFVLWVVLDLECRHYLHL